MRQSLTLVFERRPLVPSIQMYSARTFPPWSKFMYFRSCTTNQHLSSPMFERESIWSLTLPVFEMVVDSACVDIQHVRFQTLSSADHPP